MTATDMGDGLFTASELGVELGRRVERVEWGLRATADSFLRRKGQVEIRPSEDNARLILDGVARGEHYGWRNVELVRRTVVTYTSDWERVESGTPTQESDR